MTTRGDVERRDEHARRAAEELARDGSFVRYLPSLYAPEDEICFYLFEAASADAVRDAAFRAGFAFEWRTETARRRTEWSDETSNRVRCPR